MVKQVKIIFFVLPAPSFLEFSSIKRQKKIDHLCARYFTYTITFPFYDNQ